MILPEHKRFIINSLYGLIEGSAGSLESMLKSNFNRKFGFNPEKLNVTSTNKQVKNEGGFSAWVGTMTVFLKIDVDTYSLTRDWFEEYEHDTNHKNYQDDYFYESEDCLSSKKSKALLEEITPHGIAKTRLNTFDND